MVARSSGTTGLDLATMARIKLAALSDLKEPLMPYDFHLPDMSCGHCVATVTETVKGLDRAATLDFDREARRVRIASELSREVLARALSEAGYAPADAGA
jgi:copper chaperone